MIFKNRREAGRKLAEKLKKYAGQKDVLILGLPRGGVIVAAEVASSLQSHLDIVAPRKLGAPDNEELAIGAVSEDGRPILDENIIKMLAVSKKYLKEQIKKAKAESERRLKLYRGDRQKLKIKNKTVIIIDDGIATGATMRAAITSCRKKQAKKIIVAVPVSARDTFKKIKEEADEVISLQLPIYFGAVGQFYKEFPQTEDREVIKILQTHT